MLHRLIPAPVLALGLLVALAACEQGEALEGTLAGVMPGSGGETYDYAALEVPLALPAGPAVAIAVIDARPYVLDGDESPRFVGTTARRGRGGVEVTTRSERPLADVLAEALARAFERQGLAAAAVPRPPGADEPEMLAGTLAALADTGAERLLVLRLREWRTDAQVRVTARWELEATVHDRAGRVLGRRTTRGTERIGTRGLSSGGAGPQAVAALAQRLGFLLEHPEIAGALAPA